MSSLGRYLRFPAEIETAMIAQGVLPGPEGYDVHAHEAWAPAYKAVGATMPKEIVSRATKEMQKGVAFIRRVEDYHRASADILINFPWTAADTIKEKCQISLLRVLGYNLDGIEEEIGAPPELALQPVRAEIGKATYYCGAAFLEGKTNNAHRVKFVEEKMPDIWKRFNPRRYQIPDGFGLPKNLTLLAAAVEVSALTGFRQQGTDPHTSGPIAYLALSRLGSLDVPTYFVGREMADALMRTDLPEKFTLEDLRWPLPALQICLPEGVLVDSIGHSYTTMVIAQVDEGQSYRLVPGIEDAGVIAPATAIVTLAYSPTAIGTACWHHELNSDPVSIGSVDQFVRPLSRSEENADSDRISKEFADTCRRLAIQVMLAMVARPEMIEIEALARPPKVKGGKEIHPGLWNPNFIGRAYRSKITSNQEEGDSEDGKKRTHWRRGHFRNYLVSRGFKEDKVLWIEPILVNAPE
jgi:hypothetical protein